MCKQTIARVVQRLEYNGASRYGIIAIVKLG